MLKPEGFHESGPYLSLPDITGMREALERKLKEYRARLKNNVYQSPELLGKNDAFVKQFVLGKLLEGANRGESGAVSTVALSREFEEEFGKLDPEVFNNACSVIQDYLETGGANTRGGTGISGGRDPQRE